MTWFKPFPPQNEIVAYAIPFFLLLIGIEVVVSIREQRDSYVFKDAAASISMGIGSAIINFGMKGVAYAVYLYLYEFRLFEIGWQWWAWVLLFFADDFTFYWHHRLSHEVRLLWAAHVNHHSSVNYTLATALRQSWAELFYKYIWWLWLPLVGFEPLMILMMMSISLIYQFWVHTEYIDRFPFFIEAIFNTPSHHRVHHASNIRYLDRNHAGILIIWDKLFGTFAPELKEEKPVYGITTNIHTYNPLKIASHEFLALWHDIKSSRGAINKLKYMLYSPGWSADGIDQRAKTLRKQYLQNLANKNGV
jgi:sterol desaturase/sphingolipid hydroxylase (fatty acid hydroxylase superfamily)